PLISEDSRCSTGAPATVRLSKGIHSRDFCFRTQPSRSLRRGEAHFGLYTHSLRRTKASMIYKATGNLRAIQILLGHTKIENTVRYLGVDIEDALILAERTEI
ncbi:MAG: tyrosine-type recombinase/integrase, partial [Nitrobacter sp.]